MPTSNVTVRPERVIKARVPVMPARPVKEVLKEMPAHYLENQRGNSKIKDCCKDTENLVYETFKTDEALPKANLGVLTCTECGCKHYRVAHGPGRAT